MDSTMRESYYPLNSAVKGKKNTNNLPNNSFSVQLKSLGFFLLRKDELK